MAHVERPSPVQVEQIAFRQPALLNLLVAYFVLEWQRVTNGRRPHGRDQCGEARLIPNYVRIWGKDQCVTAIQQSPKTRNAGEPGFITEWLEEIST